MRQSARAARDRIAGDRLRVDGDTVAPAHGDRHRERLGRGDGLAARTPTRMHGSPRRDRSSAASRGRSAGTSVRVRPRPVRGRSCSSPVSPGPRHRSGRDDDLVEQEDVYPPSIVSVSAWKGSGAAGTVERVQTQVGMWTKVRDVWSESGQRLDAADRPRLGEARDQRRAGGKRRGLQDRLRRRRRRRVARESGAPKVNCRPLAAPAVRRHRPRIHPRAEHVEVRGDR